MLTFESPFYEIQDVIVFRDHAVPTMFYYLAGPPHLTRADGKPNFLLLKYRNALDAMGGANPLTRQQLGGGFLVFGVDCGLTEGVKSAITSELSSKVPPGSGPISLAPVLYTKGKVNVIALDAQMSAATPPDAGADPTAHSNFVRGILGTATPSLLQDQRAIFSLALSTDAVTLLENAYDSEMSPIGVMYELEFSGLRPALAVKATVDKQRVYEQLKMGLHFGVHTGGGSGQTQTQTPPGQTQTPPGQTQTPPRTPPVQGQTPPVQGQTPPVQGQTPPVQGQTPPVQGQTPPVQGQTPPVQGQTPPAQGQAPSGQGQTPAGQGQTGQGQTGTPQSTGTQVALDADLSYSMEKLRESGAITIEIIRQQEGASVDDMQKQALDLLKESVLNDFFKPAMTDAPASAATAATAIGAANQMASTAQTSQGVAGAAGAAGGTKVELGFQLQYKKQEELKTATYDFSEVSPETRTHAPNGFFSALIGSTEKSQYIREIDLDDPFFKVLDVEVSTIADFDGLDLQSIVVDLQYGGTIDEPRVVGSVNFTKASSAPHHFQAFRDLDDFSYRYRLSYKFGQAERIAAQRHDYQTPWRASTSRALVVHPPDDVEMLHVFLEPRVVDWDIVDKIETHLVYDDKPDNFHDEHRYLVSSASPRQEWIVRLTDPARDGYQVQHLWHLKDSSEIQGALEPASGAQLFIGDPFADRLPIIIHPQVDSHNVLRVEVELHYDDPDNHMEVRKNVEILGPDFRPASISIPIVDRSKREYTYKVSLIKANGGAENQLEQKTEQLSIIVSEGGIYFDVTVTLLGAATMAAHAIDAIQVDLKAEPLDGALEVVESELFEAGGAIKTVKRLLLRADRPRQFQYRTTVFTAARDPEPSDWTVHENAILPIQVARLVSA